MDPMSLYIFAAGMSSIPVIWWSINRTRACASKWWDNRKYKNCVERHNKPMQNLQGFAIDPPLHLARYRNAGVTTSKDMDAAYERGVAVRARKRKRRKDKENLMWRA